jgi:hypothetical protein
VCYEHITTKTITEPITEPITGREGNEPETTTAKSV